MAGGRARVGRRGFLVLGAGALLSGCVQSGTPGGRETTQPTTTQRESSHPTADDETEPTTGEQEGRTIGGIGSDKNEPQATATIGGGEVGNEPPEDTIQVWNNAETSRRITITIKEKGTAGEPLFRETYRFKPDTYVTIGVSKPGKYAVSVAVEDNEPTTIEFNVDDCNWQKLSITAMPNGSMKSTITSTLAKCVSVPV